MDDNHHSDVIELLDKLLQLEYERGRLRAQLEFHLRVITLGLQTEPPKVSAPIPESVKIPPPKRKTPGALESRLLEALATGKIMTTRELSATVGSSSETVRQTLLKMVGKSLVIKEDRGLYRTAAVAQAEASH